MNLIDEMTVSEKNDLLTKSFIELWEDLWGIKSDGSSEETISSEKFNNLIQGCIMGNESDLCLSMISVVPNCIISSQEHISKKPIIICVLSKSKHANAIYRNNIIVFQNLQPCTIY